jgi:hypothetical protein
MELIQTQIPDIPAWKSVFKADVPMSTFQSVTKYVSKNWAWFTGGTVVIVVLIIIAMSNQNKPKKRKEEKEILPPLNPVSNNSKNAFQK